MNLINASILGIIQGLTEFLPVSSSGHLVLMQRFIPGFSQPGILFDVILHFATLLAVVYFYRKILFRISFKYLVLLGIGTIPAVIAGLFFRKQFEEMFSDVRFLGWEFIITGIINFLIDIKPKKSAELNYKNSFVIGLSQAVAIIPAISRSGATIFTGRRLGIEENKLAEYSFLLSVPAILGANILQIYSHGVGSVESEWPFYIAGFIGAFVVGLLSIRVFLKLLVTKKFKYFGYYCIILGIIVLLFVK